LKPTCLSDVIIVDNFSAVNIACLKITVAQNIGGLKLPKNSQQLRLKDGIREASLCIHHEDKESYGSAEQRLSIF